MGQMESKDEKRTTKKLFRSPFAISASGCVPQLPLPLYPVSPYPTTMLEKVDNRLRWWGGEPDPITPGDEEGAEEEEQPAQVRVWVGECGVVSSGDRSNW
jgi:hypothetical protein